MSYHNQHPPYQYQQYEPRPLITGRRVAGAVALAAVASLTAYTMHDAPKLEPAPYELQLEGEVDMGKTYDDLRTRITSTDIGHDAAGVKVIKLGEYIPTLGRMATDGKAEFINVAPTMSPEVSEDLDKVIEADAATLNSLAWQGKIGAIRFNMAVDPNEAEFKDRPAGDMRFIPRGMPGASSTGAVIEYTLPAKGEVPLKTIAGMTNHEATHIRQRNLTAVDKFHEAERAQLGDPVDVDLNAYREDLAILRKASVDVAEQSPAVIAAAQKVLAATENSKTEVAKQLRKIAQSIVEGTFDTLQPTEQTPSMVGDFAIDAGRIDKPSFVLAKNLKDIEYKRVTAEQEAASSDLDSAFEDALKLPDSPLSLFDESSYGNAEVYGHPESNTAENIVGAENALHMYPQRLAAKIKQLPAHIQKIVLRFVKRTNADTQRANEAGYVSDSTKALHDQLNKNMAWVEKQVENIPPK